MKDLERPVMKDLEKLRGTIEKEIHRLLKELDAGTIDRRTLESGLKNLRKHVFKIPWFKPYIDKK
ncbi:MAG: hypothetical protein QOI88_3522 [Gammaproteobacteria bacterium]|jgi:hypothetical protein|nr:hypothetical protein [Gammaproteobacteria bacterium]